MLCSGCAPDRVQWLIRQVWVGGCGWVVTRSSFDPVLSLQHPLRLQVAGLPWRVCTSRAVHTACKLQLQRRSTCCCNIEQGSCTSWCDLYSARDTAAMHAQAVQGHAHVQVCCPSGVVGFKARASRPPGCEQRLTPANNACRATNQLNLLVQNPHTQTVPSVEQEPLCTQARLHTCRGWPPRS